MSSETLFWGFYVLLFGLAIGSFLNVVILRGLSEESIVFPPSKCPKCNKPLKWYMNLPVISYIFLRGKCAFCKKPISIQYPLVELTNAVLYILMYLNFGLSFKTLFLCALSSLFVLIATTDLKERIVFDLHCWIMVALGVLYNILKLGNVSVLESVLGVLAGFLAFEIMAKFGTIIAKTRTFGEGDTLIAMGLGAFFGWKWLLVIIFLSVILQSIFTLPLLVIKNIKNKDYLEAFALVVVVFSIIGLHFAKDYAYITCAICAVLLWCLFVILKGVKKKANNPQNFYMPPFGPALVSAGLVIIFYSKEILNFLI